MSEEIYCECCHGATVFTVTVTIQWETPKFTEGEVIEVCPRCENDILEIATFMDEHYE